MKERPKLNFITYIFMLYQSGLIALGKLENPITKKTGVELEEVKGIIELLEVIEEKTKGNLNNEEERTLKMLLDTLRLNFVEENDKLNKEKPAGDSEKKNEDDLEIH